MSEEKKGYDEHARKVALECVHNAVVYGPDACTPECLSQSADNVARVIKRELQAQEELFTEALKHLKEWRERQDAAFANLNRILESLWLAEEHIDESLMTVIEPSISVKGLIKECADDVQKILNARKGQGDDHRDAPGDS